mmetsp:Transcript_7763/g.48152  ORF Transcript_7763/g.48152 Transcript_7763/m.48152 type:complete len:413 (+) Transcript_7763:109-1347(+)
MPLWKESPRQEDSPESSRSTQEATVGKRTGLWTTLENCIVRPPRALYDTNDLLGGKKGRFRLKGQRYTRKDFPLRNKDGHLLQCSHYRPEQEPNEKLPCVVSLHSNSGSRCCAAKAALVILPMQCTLLAFDFAGSGMSEGEFVTLGAREVEDVEVVVQHLRDSDMAKVIGLWGRSMGAVTCMLYAERDPSIAGMVVDSPFSRLTDLMVEICSTQQMRLPKFMAKLGVKILKKSIKKRAKLNIGAVDPLSKVGTSFVPVLFGHGQGDDFIPKHHSERLYEGYAGDKNLIIFDGGHNSVRPFFFYDSVSIFFMNVFDARDQVHTLDSSQSLYDSGSWRADAEQVGLCTSEAEERLLRLLHSSQVASYHEGFLSPAELVNGGAAADDSEGSSTSDRDLESELVQQAIAQSLREMT